MVSAIANRTASSDGRPRADSVAWSPDATQVAFSEGSEIYVAKSDFSDRRKLVTAENPVYALSFSSDGGRLRFFIVDPRNGSSSIWEIARNLGEQRWQTIFAIGSQPRCELVRYDGKSGFAPYLDGGSVSDLAFSADGEWVAYVSVPEGQLWRSRVDGSERLQLTSEGMSAALPRWSPDGKEITFMGTNLKTDWLAYLISSDGTGLRQLIPGVDAGYDRGSNWDIRSGG